MKKGFKENIEKATHYAYGIIRATRAEAAQNEAEFDGVTTE